MVQTKVIKQGHLPCKPLLFQLIQVLLEEASLSSYDMANHILCHVVAKVAYLSCHRKGDDGLEEIHHSSKEVNTKRVNKRLCLPCLA